MQKIQKLYRSDYSGQDVKTIGLYIDSEWKYQEEFINNPFTNFKPFSDRALVIGNGISRTEFDLSFLLEGRSYVGANWERLKNTKRFYTYGCNALYRNWKTDFLIATGEGIIKELSESEYVDSNIVYANNWTLTKYPNKFHFIPQDPHWNSGAIAAYLAAFDGHKRIFLMGFDGIDNLSNNSNVYAGTTNYPAVNETILEDYWIQSLNLVMETYSDTEFIRVAPTDSFRTPELWKYRLNFRTISFRQFVLEADI